MNLVMLPLVFIERAEDRAEFARWCAEQNKRNGGRNMDVFYSPVSQDVGE